MDVDSRYQRIRRQWFWKARWHVLVLSVLGALLAWAPIGLLDRFMFDLTSVLAWSKPPVKIVIVEIDNATKTRLRQPPDRPIDRRLYAQALRRLKSDGARVVVFDLLFDTPSDNPEADSDFGKALQECGAAILAVEIVEGTEATHDTITVLKPVEALATNAAAWGSSAVALDPDRCVRRHMTNPPVAPGLGVQAARLLDVPSALDYESAGVVPPTRFLHWYRPHEFRRIDFAALIQATNSLNLRGAVVVIGAKPGPGLPGAVSDTFASPWSRFNGGFVSGATVHAVILANYAAGDWIRDMPEAVRIGFGVFGAAVVMLAAWRLNARRPILVWCVPPAALLLSAALAVTLFCAVHVWWPWLLVGGLVPAVAAFWLRWKPVPLPLDIFISYRRKADGETAALLFRELNRRGLVAFYAPENIPAGSFHEHLPAQIHRSRCMVLVLSPRTLAAESLQGIDWVRFEIHAARAAHKTFIPVLKDGFGFRADSWPADLGTLNEWQSFTAVEYEGDGQISTVVEKVINLVQRL